jgi:hypothetical protein
MNLLLKRPYSLYDHWSYPLHITNRTGVVFWRHLLFPVLGLNTRQPWIYDSVREWFEE